MQHVVVHSSPCSPFINKYLPLYLGAKQRPNSNPLLKDQQSSVLPTVLLLFASVCYSIYAFLHIKYGLLEVSTNGTPHLEKMTLSAFRFCHQGPMLVKVIRKYTTSGINYPKKVFIILATGGSMGCSWVLQLLFCEKSQKCAYLNYH